MRYTYQHPFATYQESPVLTRNQFLILNALRTHDAITAQSQIAELVGLSVGTVNSVIRGLRERRWVEDRSFELTPAGLEQLEPYRVDNAIILAAGFSSHFAPVSYERPKGLLTVRGEVLIERQIRQLHEAGIEDITVVVGYMKELFFYLGEKYGVNIVINENYATRDNHSSLYLVRDKLARTFICSSDNYFAENVFEPYVYEAYYAAVYSEGYTEEWCMEVRAHDVIDKITIGGSDSWYMLGHVFYDEAFSQTMRMILEKEYDLPATRTKLWEHLFIDHISELRMVMRRYPDGIIYEFDSLADMHLFDPTFIDNVDSRILDNISTVLGCARSDIRDIDPIKLGGTNLSCRFRVGDIWYVYRHPGANTSEFINRESEAFSENVARDLDLDATFIYEDPQSGWKLSYYIDDCEPFDYHNPDHVAKAMEMARTLHECETHSPWSADLRESVHKTVALLDKYDRASFSDFVALHEQFEHLYELVQDDDVLPCLCHNDFFATNYLVHDDRMDLIDWEYSGMSDYAADLGAFICCCADYEYEDVLAVLRSYFGREPDDRELRHCISYISLAGFRWYAWALYKDVCGGPIGELLYTWYRYAKEYGQRALELYEDVSAQ